MHEHFSIIGGHVPGPQNLRLYPYLPSSIALLSLLSLSDRQTDWSVNDLMFLTSAYEGGWPVLSVTITSTHWQCRVDMPTQLSLSEGSKYLKPNFCPGWTWNCLSGYLSVCLPPTPIDFEVIDVPLLINVFCSNDFSIIEISAGIEPFERHLKGAIWSVWMHTHTCIHAYERVFIRRAVWESSGSIIFWCPHALW